MIPELFCDVEWERIFIVTDYQALSTCNSVQFSPVWRWEFTRSIAFCLTGSSTKYTSVTIVTDLVKRSFHCINRWVPQPELLRTLNDNPCIVFLLSGISCYWGFRASITKVSSKTKHGLFDRINGKALFTDNCWWTRKVWRQQKIVQKMWEDFNRWALFCDPLAHKATTVLIAKKINGTALNMFSSRSRQMA